MLIETEAYRASMDELPADVQRLARRKVRLLSSNRGYPSLKVHRMDNARGVWSCRINLCHRLLFQAEGDPLRLLEILHHDTYTRI